MSDCIYLVTAACGQYEPDHWFVLAFESREEADRFAIDYNERAEAIEQKVRDYCFDNEEPSTEADDDAAYDAWHAWVAARDAIRKEHPDVRSHIHCEQPYYCVQEVEFQPESTKDS